jgi:hypothetical protein
MRPSRVLFGSAAALPPFLFLVDYINTAGFEFSTGQWLFRPEHGGVPASDSICLGNKRGRTNQTSVCRDIAKDSKSNPDLRRCNSHKSRLIGTQLLWTSLICEDPSIRWSGVQDRM